jgi:hypothetical protein
MPETVLRVRIKGQTKQTGPVSLRDSQLGRRKDYMNG